MRLTPEQNLPLTLLDLEVITLRQYPLLAVLPADDVDAPLSTSSERRVRRPDVRSLGRIDVLSDGLGRVGRGGVDHLDRQLGGVCADGLCLSDVSHCRGRTYARR